MPLARHGEGKGIFPSQPGLTDSDFRNFRTLVYELSRISLGENKRELVRTRLGKVMRTLGIPTYRAYYEYVANDTTGKAGVQLINAISTNLTSFFRENKHFEYLGNSLLPSIVKNFRERGISRLRFWSAGCSTGEEPYTLAITILESMKDISGWDIKILATDIDTEVLATAAKGLYEEKRISGVPDNIRMKYFTRESVGRDDDDDVYSVSPALKRLITFRRLDLTNDYPFKGPFQVIFCRNVMIYFDRPTQEGIVNRFYDILSPEGCIFVGHSESLTGVSHKFKYLQPTVYGK